MAVRVSSSGPRGAKTYEIRWKNGELYDYTDNAYAAKRLAARARKEEREYYSPRRKNPTKAQKRTKARNSARKRGIVSAVKALLQKTNPSAKITGARVVKLKGGGLTIRPIKTNPHKFSEARERALRNDIERKRATYNREFGRTGQLRGKAAVAYKSWQRAVNKFDDYRAAGVREFLGRGR